MPGRGSPIPLKEVVISTGKTPRAGYTPPDDPFLSESTGRNSFEEQRRITESSRNSSKDCLLGTGQAVRSSAEGGAEEPATATASGRAGADVPGAAPVSEQPGAGGLAQRLLGRLSSRRGNTQAPAAEQRWASSDRPTPGDEVGSSGRPQLDGSLPEPPSLRNTSLPHVGWLAGLGAGEGATRTNSRVTLPDTIGDAPPATPRSPFRTSQSQSGKKETGAADADAAKAPPLLDFADLSDDEAETPPAETLTAKKAFWKQLWFVSVLIPICVSILFLCTAAIYKALHPGSDFANELTQWRWFLFIGLLVPVYWAAEGLSRLAYFALEYCLWTNKALLYYITGTQKPLARVILWGLVAVIWAACFAREKHVSGAWNKVFFIFLHIFLCILLFFAAQLLIHVLARMLATYFHKQSFFEKMQDTLAKEYYFNVLSKPRRGSLLSTYKSSPLQTSEDKEAAAAGAAGDEPATPNGFTVPSADISLTPDASAGPKAAPDPPSQDSLRRSSTATGGYGASGQLSRQDAALISGLSDMQQGSLQPAPAPEPRPSRSSLPAAPQALQVEPTTPHFRTTSMPDLDSGVLRHPESGPGAHVHHQRAATSQGQAQLLLHPGTPLVSAPPSSRGQPSLEVDGRGSRGGTARSGSAGATPRTPGDASTQPSEAAPAKRLQRIRERLVAVHRMNKLEAMKEGEGDGAEVEEDGVPLGPALTADHILAKLQRVESHIAAHAFNWGLTDEVRDTSDAEAKRLALYLFWNIKPSGSTSDFNKAFITVEDVQAFFPHNEAMAQAAFSFVDTDADNRVTLPELHEAVLKVFRERRNLAAALKDTRAVVATLSRVIGVCVHLLMGLIYLAIFNVQFNNVWVTISTGVLAFSFIFGNSIRLMYEAVVLLFVVHPFDIGDLVVIAADTYTVLEVSLNKVMLKRWDGARVYYPNAMLSLSFITNLSRCETKGESIKVKVDLDTPVSVVEALDRAVDQFFQAHSADFKAGSHTVTFREPADPLKLTIAIFYEFTFNAWEDGDRRNVAREPFMQMVCALLVELGVQYTLPAFEQITAGESGLLAGQKLALQAGFA